MTLHCSHPDITPAGTCDLCGQHVRPPVPYVEPHRFIPGRRDMEGVSCRECGASHGNYRVHTDAVDAYR